MADRYWVGGTANWDGTAGTKWATSSGGTGGASVPTTADDVFFTNLSTGTCLIGAGNTGAKSINCTGFTGTIAGTAAITVAGSVTLVAAMTYTYTGTVTFTGTGTLITAGKTIRSVTINGSGITMTLGDAFNAPAASLTVTQGTFDTAGYSLAVFDISSSNTNVRSILLRNSAVTIAGTSIVLSTTTNLTWNAGTSTITTTSNGFNTWSGAGLTYHNFVFGATPANSMSVPNSIILNNLTITPAASASLTAVRFGGNITVNGTLTISGASPVRRTFLFSSLIGTTRTITAAAMSANDCDFRDITIAGAAAGSSPTRAGNCGGNSGINFPAPKTVYWNLAGSQNWTATGWAAGSGGTPNINNFPLAQDTAVFDNAGSAGTLTINSAGAGTAGWNIGTVNLSGRTTAMSWSFSNPASYYGSFTFGSGVTVSGTGSQTFSGRGTQTFTSAGKTIAFSLTVDAPDGTFVLGDAFVSSDFVLVTQGTFNAANYNLTCKEFSSSNSNVRTITMGSGLWTLTGVLLVWGTTTTTNLTFNKNTANILLSDTSTGSRTFNGGGLSFNKLTIGGATGTSQLTLTGANTFSELASTKTVAHTISIGSSANGMTIGTWSITGTAGNVVTLNSLNPGTRRSFNLTNVTSGIDYLSVTDIGVNQANRFYVGANSTDGGNNSNVIFTAPPAPGGNTGAFFSIL
jgi:hypothetical protein